MFANFSYNVSPNADDNGGGGGGGGGGGSNNSMPIGAVVPYAGFTAPPDWLLCDGAEYRTDLYPELFSVINFYYGVNPNISSIGSIGAYTYTGNTLSFTLSGTSLNQFLEVGTIVRPDGFVPTTGENISGTYITITIAPAIGSLGAVSGTFMQPVAGTGSGTGANINRAGVIVPDLRLASPVGVQAGTLNLASTGGSATQTLVITNLPPHSHTLWQGGASASQGSINVARLGDPNVDSNLATGGNIYRATDTPTSGSRVQQVGQDGTGQTAFSIRNPYVGMNYIIHAKN